MTYPPAGPPDPYQPPAGPPDPYQPQQPYGPPSSDPTAAYPSNPYTPPPSGQPTSGQPGYGQPTSGQPGYGQPPAADPYTQPFGAAPSYGAQPYGAQPYGAKSPGAPPFGPGYGAPTGTNVMAILALVFAFIFSPLAIVFGHIAKRQIRRTGEQGDGVATWGLWLGYIFTALSVLACLGTILLGMASSVSSVST